MRTLKLKKPGATSAPSFLQTTKILHKCGGGGAEPPWKSINFSFVNTFYQSLSLSTRKKCTPSALFFCWGRPPLKRPQISPKSYLALSHERLLARPLLVSTENLLTHYRSPSATDQDTKILGRSKNHSSSDHPSTQGRGSQTTHPTEGWLGC